MKRLLALLAAPAASFCLIGAAAPAAALATCYSSTQSSQTYSDSSSDGDAGLAPEMIGAVAVTDSACGIGMAPALSNRPSGLLSSDVSAIYINTDANSSTGSSTFSGADKVVMTLGGYAPRVGTWNGSTFDFNAGPDLVENSDGGGFIGT